jgi:membrane-bound metal-dependent hydrolase YbcI (DUF457 family)
MLKKRKFHFMCLSFGAMIPDIEIFPLLPFSTGLEYARGPLHSLIGALTIDILIVLMIAYFFVPPIGRWFKRHTKNKWHVFAGVDVTKAPTDPMWAMASAGIGTLSHVIIDLFTHTFNPIFWPYASTNVSWELFGPNFLSSVIFMIPLGIIAVSLLLLYWTKPHVPE